MNTPKTICITGATSGIGWATAQRLAKDGHRLLLCGRRQERLQTLEQDLSCPVHTLQFDVRDKKDVFAAITQLPKAWQQIDVLINNAGNAHGLDPVQSANLDDWDAMIDSNVKGLMYVTKAFLPHFLEQKHGQIINLGSIAGQEVYPNGSVYCASKFAVDAFTKGLRMDLNKHGIRVGAIHPGLVETEFSLVRFKGDTSRADKVYADISALQADDVAQAIAFMIDAPAHVTVADLTLLPTDQASSMVINRRE